MASKPSLVGLDIHILMDNVSEYEGLYKEKGLSMLISAKYPKKELNILFDTSINGNKVISNAKEMNLDLSKVTYIVLSHKHWDHTEGLLPILKFKDSWTPILHGKGFFRQSIAIDPFLRHTTRMPFLKQEIMRLKGMPTPIEGPVEFAPGIFLSGRIQLQTEFEAPPARYRVPPSMTQDEMEEEIALIVNFKGKLVVVSGCSHRGVVNTIKKAISITGIQRVKALIGGLHLKTVSGRRISRTVEELSKLDVEEFYIGHCTGEKALKAFRSVFGDSVSRTKSGMVIRF